MIALDLRVCEFHGHSMKSSILLPLTLCFASVMHLPMRLSAEVAVAPANAISDLKDRTFEARDTTNFADEKDPDACACLKGLDWNRGNFSVQTTTAEKGRGDFLVRFPTPRPSGDATNDLVAMEWYVARDENNQPKRAPAIVIVHESGRGMAAALIFSRGLRHLGYHTFLIHLPGYGARTSDFTGDIKQMFPGLQQAVADVRRARDAVASLPLVDTSLIALQGTSLGGFIVATVAGIDQGYQKSFILLAGGHLAKVILTGQKDAANMRKRFAEAGISDEQINDLSHGIEPLRLARRVNPKQTWLFSGKYDEVVPPACSKAFVEAAQLKDGHHVEYPVGHYTAALFMPSMLERIHDLMMGREPKPVAPAP